MQTFEVLRMLREENTNQLNPTEFGKLLNMSQRKISRLETGQAEPTPEDIKAYCNFFKVSADYILQLPDNYTYPKLLNNKEIKNT